MDSSGGCDKQTDEGLMEVFGVCSCYLHRGSRNPRSCTRAAPFPRLPFSPQLCIFDQIHNLFPRGLGA